MQKTTTATTTLSSKINTILYFGKQEDREQLAWSHIPSPCMIGRVARFLKVPANFPP